MKRNLMTLFFALSLAAVFPLAAFGGPAPPTVDADGDGVDDAFDSCLGVFNSGQADADHDGCGDQCDTICDPNSNGTVDINDITAAAGCFNCVNPVGAQFDCNMNGTVDIADITGLAGSFNATSGPSGIPSVNPLRRCGTTVLKKLPDLGSVYLNCCTLP